MKKLITIILILALILPAAALADDSAVVGCWAHYELQTDGTPVMSMLYLAEDHTCYFVIQAFHHDEPGIGRTHIGTWEYRSDGTVYAKTGNSTSTELSFYSESLAINKKTLDVYVNITPFSLK